MPILMAVLRSGKWAMVDEHDHSNWLGMGQIDLTVCRKNQWLPDPLVPAQVIDRFSALLLTLPGEISIQFISEVLAISFRQRRWTTRLNTG